MLFRSAIATSEFRPYLSQLKSKRILLDHLHFVWQLPPNDFDYSQRISRLKVLFTHAFKANHLTSSPVSASRLKHRGSDVWQRRFWEHTIQDEADLHQYLDYVQWVSKGRYVQDWGCICGRKVLKPLNFKDISQKVGE